MPQELGAWLTAADIFVTPYPNLDQIVSGTLSYAMGAGKAIVSTPYAYARERLADGRGRLVAAGSTTQPLGGGAHRAGPGPGAAGSHGRRAYAYSRGMHWPEVGAAYRRVFDRVSRRVPAKRAGRHADRDPRPLTTHVPDRPLPPARRQHLERMTGPLGIWQHADGIEPDPAFGTCTDDVARALTVDLLQRRMLGWEAVIGTARRSMAYLTAAFDPAAGDLPRLPRRRRRVAGRGRLAGLPGPRAAVAGHRRP